MPDTSAIQEIRGDHTLRLAWNNRTAPKQNGLFVLIVLFWLLWSAATVYVTAMASLEVFPLWLAVILPGFGWLLTLGIPLSCLGRWIVEEVAISCTDITVRGQWILPRKPRTFSIRSEGRPLELAFGFIGPDDGEQRETMLTLNLFVPRSFGWPKRIMIGYWLAPYLKEHLFTTLETFATAHQLPLLIKRYHVAESQTSLKPVG